MIGEILSILLTIFLCVAVTTFITDGDIIFGILSIYLNFVMLEGIDETPQLN